MFYKVRNTGKLLDGYIVESGEVKDLAGQNNLVEVLKVIDTNSIVGDRDFALPVAPGTIYVSATNLEQYDYDPNREYSAFNHLGALRFTGEMNSGNIKVVYSLFEKGLSVGVVELPKIQGGPMRTVYSQYFYSEIDEVRKQLESRLTAGDVDDLIFFLKAKKKEELDGKEG